MAPHAAYEAAVAAGDIQSDPAQLDAVLALQQVYDEVMKPVPSPGVLSRLFGAGSSAPGVKGLYLWGGVGRGKTYLMDVFFDSLPLEDKLRLHFHRFMRSVHQQLRDLQGEPDPLAKIAANFAARARILCFDEFFVSDITDAMILARLVEGLFERGVVLVATSNVLPDNLYENGLQRKKFIPAIEMIKENTRVMNVDGGVDYRLRALEVAEIYHFPLDEGADAGLLSSFSAICPDRGESEVDLEVEGRIIRARRSGDGVAWFDFMELCDGPRSQNDYIELARIYQTVLVSDVPVLDGDREDQARRFISLIDEFYDRNVKCILSAATSIEKIYQGTRLQFEFQRTESRLIEMQSREYLAREHKP